ncbi:hypothetical protein [Marinobacter adhaerens]|jgi:hypothetical protein|uniref:hypothetical protein n=1 Tax=Marinobacter adhaerens TaxID=1033846 RepID=UPI001E4F9AD2|nr:hypothetical protein [Marinobacter adhaerens]MCD1648941.1 hypothetical protein [Marinobacter adhaerens]
MPFLKFFSVSVLLSVLAGCATPKQFDGPERADSEVAILHIGEHLIVERLNGEWPGIGLVDTYKFLSGKVSVGLRTTWGISSRIVLAFEAEAGEQYKVQAYFREEEGLDMWTAEIIDLRHNKIVTNERRTDRSLL